MFMILVTTQVSCHGATNGCGISVHSLVVDFPTLTQAEMALNAINQENNMTHMYQKAIPLNWRQDG